MPSSGSKARGRVPGIDDLPRFRLLDGPSPLTPLPRFSAALGGRAEVWIKREDLLPLAFGGNKLRNLEFLVGEALAAGADTLVTSGRRWSNHCRLTAAAGARAGLAVHLVLTGPPPPTEGANVRLDRLLGAEVHVTATGNRAERETLVADVAARLRATGRRPYVIGVGGAGAVGAAGQVIAARELTEQATAAGATIDALVLPSATGGTQAGLMAGIRLAGASTRVLGFAVAQPLDVLMGTIGDTLRDLGELTRTSMEGLEIELDARQLGSGYGVPTPAADEATALLARSEGSWSTRSTPPRPWPGSSSGSSTAGSMAGASSSGMPAAHRGSSRRSTRPARSAPSCPAARAARGARSAVDAAASAH